MKTSVAALADDRLLTPPVGEWGEVKYRLISSYAGMFAKATRQKWDLRVYVDLFAGPGRARLKRSGRIVAGSPILALEAVPSFDYCIFCDMDEKRLDVLRTRISVAFRSRAVTYICGDANCCVDRVLAAIPVASRSCTVLGFCVLDPFGMSGLKFTTVKALATRFMDFLVLVPSGMDASRFWAKYERVGDDTVAHFLGQTDWRDGWAKLMKRRYGLGRFVLERFTEQMATLGYGRGPAELVRAVDNRRPLYHLAFFSRHPLGLKLAREAVEYSQEQRSFGFEGSEG